MPKTLLDLEKERKLAEFRKKLQKAQERKDVDMGKVIIKQVEALYRSIGREEKIPLPKWITE